MHSSLRTKTNIAFILAWGTIATALVATLSLPPRPLLAVAALLGTITGWVHASAIRSSAPTLREATTMLQVRTALAATGAGKSYFALLWCGPLILFVLALWQPGANIALAFAPAYVVFALCREVMTLPAIVALNRVPPTTV